MINICQLLCEMELLNIYSVLHAWYTPLQIRVFVVWSFEFYVHKHNECMDLLVVYSHLSIVSIGTPLAHIIHDFTTYNGFLVKIRQAMFVKTAYWWTQNPTRSTIPYASITGPIEQWQNISWHIVTSFSTLSCIFEISWLFFLYVQPRMPRETHYFETLPSHVGGSHFTIHSTVGLTAYSVSNKTSTPSTNASLCCRNNRISPKGPVTIIRNGKEIKVNCSRLYQRNYSKQSANIIFTSWSFTTPIKLQFRLYQYTSICNAVWRHIFPWHMVHIISQAACTGFMEYEKKNEIWSWVSWWYAPGLELICICIHMKQSEVI